MTDRSNDAGIRLDALPGGRVVGDATVRVTGIAHDSRAVRAGDLFACVRGDHHDGHDFAALAVEQGAVALVVEHVLDVSMPQLVVDDVRLAIGPVAAAVHGHPSTAMRVVGITGTNGKTTTAHLLAAILEASGTPTGVLGTLSGGHTTPEAPELQARLRASRDAGDGAVVMEVSSHALAMHRVDGTRFAAAVFTNLGTDHLDLHGTAEEYFRAKARLFSPALADIGVTNVDDAHGRLLFDAAPIDMVAYALDDATDIEVTATRHRFSWRGRTVSVGIGGGFNVNNSIAAATTAATLGIDLDAIVDGLATASPVPGRFEIVESDDGRDGGITVVVDYAHTPDGLANVIAAGREVADSGGKVIVVFGCGGDRDRSKRPQMGATAAELADAVVVTSDNPRSEAPMAIIDAVLAGIGPDDRRRVVVEPDRATAIDLAVERAGRGDVIIVAGKGHERTQTIGDRVVDFDDRDHALAALRRRT